MFVLFCLFVCLFSSRDSYLYHDVVSAATFWKRQVVVTEIQSAYQLLERLLGPAAAIVFGLGLVCSGSRRAISGTLAGQIVMEVRDCVCAPVLRLLSRTLFRCFCVHTLRFPLTRFGFILS